MRYFLFYLKVDWVESELCQPKKNKKNKTEYNAFFYEMICKCMGENFIGLRFKWVRGVFGQTNLNWANAWATQRKCGRGGGAENTAYLNRF